jgi:hypothetical protein
MIYTVYTSLYHLFKWWFGGWFIGLPTVTCLKRASKISAAQQGDRAWAKRSCQRILQGNTGTSDHRVMGVSCLRWVCVSVSISICLSFYLSICLPLSCLSIHPSRYLYINTVCIYIYTYNLQYLLTCDCVAGCLWISIYVCRSTQEYTCNVSCRAVWLFQTESFSSPSRGPHAISYNSYTSYNRRLFHVMRTNHIASFQNVQSPGDLETFRLEQIQGTAELAPTYCKVYSNLSGGAKKCETQAMSSLGPSSSNCNAGSLLGRTWVTD